MARVNSGSVSRARGGQTTRVLVVGGSRARGEVLASAEIYDPAKSDPVSVGSMGGTRQKSEG